ncbi:MAG: phosphate-starvation-inducible PsiE family protein [Verrucomicrobiae bacterium]
MPGLDNSTDPLIKMLRKAIHLAVRGLAVLMTLLILVGTVDVGWTLFNKLIQAEPMFVLDVSDILATFGAFMAVLIAIEIFVNITMYLRDDIIHVRIVMATAIMAIARKVIIMDFKQTEPGFVWATAAVILAACVGYWLLHKCDPDRKPTDPES